MAVHREQDRRAERAGRILDAAAELIGRIGIDKTTLNDVVRASGVAKSTLYLHWPNRDELYRALLRRERLAMLQAVRDRIAAAGAPATPGALYGELLLALHRSPLLLGSLDPWGSPAVRGLLSEKWRAMAAQAPRIDASAYCADLQEHGLVRTDRPAADLAEAVHSLLAGFLFPGLHRPPDRPASGGPAEPDDSAEALHRAALLTDALDRVLAPDGAARPPDAAQTGRITLAHLDRFTAHARDRLALSFPVSGAAGATGAGSGAADSAATPGGAGGAPARERRNR